MARKPTGSSHPAVVATRLKLRRCGKFLRVGEPDPRLGQGGSVPHRGGSGSYGASNAALEAWNLTLAAELGVDQITANVIAPGYIEGTDFFRGGMTDQRRAALIEQTATGRAGTPEDVSGAVLFLASPGARHITGQTLHVNGGALI